MRCPSLSLASRSLVSVGAAGGAALPEKPLAAVSSGAGGRIGTGSLSAGTVLPFAVLPAGVLGSLWMCAPLWMEHFPVADHRGSPLEKVDMPGNGAVLRRGAAVGFGVLILHEMRAANYTMVEEVISGENALSEIPELAIMDTDRKILSALEASSSVQAAIGEGDKVTINGLVPAEHADVQKILSEFLEEGQYQFSEVGTIAQFGEIGTLYYDIFDREEGIRIITEKLSTGDLQKTVTVYSGDPEEKLSVVIYENYEGTFQKIVRQRLWFYDLLQVPEET